MRADYDSEGDTLAITLVEVDHADDGDDTIPGTVVLLRDGGPVAIDVLNASDVGALDALEHVARRYGLDHEALVAAARSALAVPDRTVVLDVLGRSA